MMIYDVSKGFENSSIILADSGKMSVTPDKTHLFYASGTANRSKTSRTLPPTCAMCHTAANRST